MTHGKGMFKWFGVADEDLTPLPAKAALPAALSGDMTFASGSELELDAENGAVVSPVAVTGQLKFESGAKIVVKGFDDEVKAGDRLLIGAAGTCVGGENVTFDFGREFVPSQRPYLSFRQGKLYVSFGKSGFTMLVR